jgi:hypothetical protein
VQRTARTPDGRTLAIEEAGDPNGRPVLIHGGTPNSRHLYPPNTIDAAVHGLRLISYDRPVTAAQPRSRGAASPTAQPTSGPSARSSASTGWPCGGISGGGPHLLACAALLPDLVTAAASLASPAPLDAEGLDWFADMGELNAEDTRLFCAARWRPGPSWSPTGRTSWPRRRPI